MEKLYIVVRADLSPGLQLSQALHAGQEWVIQRTESARAWREHSNTVVVVTASDEAALVTLQRRADLSEVDCVAFYDPDLSPTLTALALGPGEGARKICRGLPLALREIGSHGAARVRTPEVDGAGL